MKILFFNTLYYPNSVGGAEKSVQSLAESLRDEGISVTIVSTTYKKNNYFEFINGIKVYYLNTKNIYWGFDQKNHNKFSKFIWHVLDIFNFKIKRNLIEIIQMEKPDIIHTNNLSGFSVSVWQIATRNGIKLVHTLRDYYLMCPKVTMFKKGKNCDKQCLKCNVFSKIKLKYSKDINAVVGISQFILEKHFKMDYFSNSKFLKVIGNDVGIINPQFKIKLYDKVVFGFIGQITESKGVFHLLSVFKELGTYGYKNCELLIAGNLESDYARKLQMDFKLANVNFLGKVDSNEFYNKIDVLIVPSLWNEPFGRVVVEGIKHQKYVLGSKRGGIKELLFEDDLFEPNSDELINKIKEILINKIIPKQKNNYEVDVTSQYIELYNNVILLEKGG